jgi:serine O-acetyltransferase
MDTYARIKTTLDELMKSYSDGDAVNQIEGLNLPDRGVLLECLGRLHTLLFPGFVGGEKLTSATIAEFARNQLLHLHADLTREVAHAIQYNCKVGHCHHCGTEQCRDCDIEDNSWTAVERLFARLAAIREVIKKDIRAGYSGDPAAASAEEIIIAYPAAYAIATYRLAHELQAMEVPLVPRLWTEAAHTRTGIDIHPGAEIGPGFFIDHGTGTVIGETCVIGADVQLYQGVTLGALAPGKGQQLRGRRRHPAIEDRVLIYSGATILGGDTVIGHDSVIGGNVWITASVAPFTRVYLSKNGQVQQPISNGDHF